MQNVSVKIFPSAQKALIDIAIRHSPNETGGVLVGTRNINNAALEFNILGVLGIAEYDEFGDAYKASPTTFVCSDRMGWANLALKAVKTFGMSYIGDWHTHPNSNYAELSSQDVSFVTQQYLLGQFLPFPPLHLLLSWYLKGLEMDITANIMLGDVILVVRPEVIEN